MAFAADLADLVRQIDAGRWPDEVARLQRVRSLAELESMARDGWLSTGTRDPRLKLVRHGSGTFLVVKYEDGWSTRVAMQPMRG
jgi:hypothetical protein